MLFAPSLFLASFLASTGCGGNGAGSGGSSFDGGVGDTGGHHDGPADVNVATDSQSITVNTPDGNSPEACAATTQTADQLPLDMYVVLDRSGSMADNDSWDQEVQALTNFFGDYRSDGIGVGIQYLPLADLCDPSAYATPAVPISVLPTGVGTLITSLSNSRPFGGTPTTVAMEGAVAFAKARQLSNPTRNIVLVLSTDGLPDTSCATVPDGGLPNSTQNAISVIQAAASLVPPIKTFVIGIGNEPALNAFAAAGGTGQAILVGAGDAGTSVDIEGELVTALASIRTAALPCSYNIPQATMGNIDFGEVNVTFTTPSSAAEQFYGVTDATGCSTTTDNWYYDSTMTHIELCPNACTKVKAATVGTVSVAYGCSTIPPPK
jgi:sarcosine oxidase gamma subunit